MPIDDSRQTMIAPQGTVAQETTATIISQDTTQVGSAASRTETEGNTKESIKKRKIRALNKAIDLCSKTAEALKSMKLQPECEALENVESKMQTPTTEENDHIDEMNGFQLMMIEMAKISDRRPKSERGSAVANPQHSSSRAAQN